MINIQFRDLKALVTNNLFNYYYYNKLANNDKGSVPYLAQVLFYIIIKIVKKKANSQDVPMRTA